MNTQLAAAVSFAVTFLTVCLHVGTWLSGALFLACLSALPVHAQYKLSRVRNVDDKRNREEVNRHPVSKGTAVSRFILFVCLWCGSGLALAQTIGAFKILAPYDGSIYPRDASKTVYGKTHGEACARRTDDEILLGFTARNRIPPEQSNITRKPLLWTPEISRPGRESASAILSKRITSKQSGGSTRCFNTTLGTPERTTTSRSRSPG